MDKKVSIIIPVYNVEKYLRQCLDSVVNQTYKDIEIICIDDGSTDSSLEILHEYSNKDARIKIITQYHEGAGSGRNKGLSIAKGKYLSFLDSDDFFEPSMLEQMCTCAEKCNADIVVCKSKIFNDGYFKDNCNIKDYLLPNKEVFSPRDIPKYAFQFHMGWCWDKLYKNSFIKGLGISFQNIKKHNDSFFSHVSMINAKKIYILNKKLVYYREKRFDSVSQKEIGEDEYILLCKEMLKEIKNYMIKNNLFESFEQSYVNYCMFHIADHFKLLSFNIQNNLKKIFEMGKYNKSFFYEKKYFYVYFISSFKILILLYNCLVKVKKLKNKIKKMFFTPKEFESLARNKQKLIPQKNLKYFCVHIVDHCNLKCRFCDHFSPLAKENYTDLISFEKDFKRLSFLSNQNVDKIGLLGGEPLIHPRITDFAKIARKYFPFSKINIVTNGLLLLKQDINFWQNCRKNNIVIAVTKYPINIDYDKISEVANKYNVILEYYNNSDKNKKTSYHIPLNLEGKKNGVDNFMRCFHANDLTLLRNGKLYTCTVAPNAFKFNDYFDKNLPVPEGIDIYKAKNMEEILNFISKPINFCKYCDVKKRTFNHEWRQSKKDIKEWTI